MTSPYSVHFNVQMATTERFSTVATAADGTRLAMHWQGPRDAPLTLVLAHGWTLDSRAWGPIAEPLASGPGAIRVLRYDHRGHGHSDPARPGSATIAQLADDLADLLRSEVAGPVVLGGHSLGGMTIMGLAERHPDLVAQRVVGAVFVATSCGDLLPLNLGLAPGLARLVSRVEHRLTRGKTIAQWLHGREQAARRAWLIRPGVRRLLFGKHPRKADVELITQCIAQGRPANLVDFRPTFDEHDRAAALVAFTHMPTLVLTGTLDRLIAVHHAESIATALPGTSLVRYSGAGHMVHLERATPVTERIGELMTAALHR